MLSDERGQRFFRLLRPALRRRRVDHVHVQHLARFIHHGDLAARAVSGIEAHDHTVAQRRLHEQGPQVQLEYCDGLLRGGFKELVFQLVLQRGVEQPAQRVPPGFQHKVARRRSRRGYGLLPHGGQRRIHIGFDGGAEYALLLAAVDGKYPVRRQL